MPLKSTISLNSHIDELKVCLIWVYLIKIEPLPLYPPHDKKIFLSWRGGRIKRRGFAPSIYPLLKRLWELKLLSSLNGSGQGNIIGIFQFGAEGQSPGKAGNPDAQG